MMESPSIKDTFNWITDYTRPGMTSIKGSARPVRDTSHLFSNATPLMSTGYITETPTVIDTFTSATTAIMKNSTSDLTSGSWSNPATTIAVPQERTTADMVVLIATPIVVLLGTAGNILCLIIMMRKHYRSCSTGVYLFCLALADTMFLWMNSMVMNFTRLVFGFDFRTLSIATCKIYIYLLMSSKCLSAWLIVAVTVERLLAISFPLKANVLATRFRAWLVVAGEALVIGAVYLLPVFTYTHNQVQWWTSCDMAPEHKLSHRDFVLKCLDLILHTLLPAVMLFVCNILLTRQVVRSRHMRTASGHVQLRATGGGGALNQRSVPSRLTAMLLLLSGVFLLMNLPMALYLLASSINTSIDLELVYRIFYTLQISNSAINFPLYCLSGPLFRRQVADLCSCCPCCPHDDHRKSYTLVTRSGVSASHSFRYEGANDSPAMARRSTPFGAVGSRPSPFATRKNGKADPESSI